MKIGVVSDTHGLLRPEVVPALDGVDQILHLGDVGKISILAELQKIAPVKAIRGNIDRDGHAPNSLRRRCCSLRGAMFICSTI